MRAGSQEGVRGGRQEHTGNHEDELEPTGWTRIHVNLSLLPSFKLQ